MDFTPTPEKFTEITHSLDRDLRDEADFDNTIVANSEMPTCHLRSLT